MSDRATNPFLTRRLFGRGGGDVATVAVVPDEDAPTVGVDSPGQSDRGQSPAADSHKDTAYWETITDLRAEVTKEIYDARKAVSGDSKERLDIHSDEARRLAEQSVAEVVGRYARSQGSAGVTMSPAAEHEMRHDVMNALFRLGRLQPLIDDSNIKEIFVTGNSPVTVVTVDGQRIERSPVANSDEELVEVLQFWADRENRKFSSTDPFLAMAKQNDDSLIIRVQAGMEWTHRPSLTIRLHRHQNWELTDLIGGGMLSDEAANFLVAAVKANKSIVLAGDQGSGKTTLLRALIREAVPRDSRLLTVEREYELGFFDDEFPNVVAGQAIEGGGERDSNGKVLGEVNPTDIMRLASQRVSADRIVVGEVKDGDECKAMMQAMHTTPSLSTTHGKNARAALDRLADLYQETGTPFAAAEKMVGRYIDVVVHSAKGIDGRHRVTEIIGVEESMEPGRPWAVTDVFKSRNGQLHPEPGGLNETLRSLRDYGYVQGVATA